MKDILFQKTLLIIKRLYGFVMKYVYRIKSWHAYSAMPKLDRKYKKDIKKFWKTYRIRTSYSDYRMYKSKGLNNNPRLIPNEVWHGKIEPKLANLEMLPGFQDKNYGDLFLGREYSPEVLVRCISGSFLNSDFSIKSLSWFENTLAQSGDVVIKPSLDSGGGRGVQIVAGESISPATLEQCKEDYAGNFIIQKKVVQHEFFSRLNSTSTNTIRLVSLLFENKVKILAAFLRIGAPGSLIDNVCSGGILIQIDTLTGHLTNKGLDRNLNTVTKVPSGIDFMGEVIPEWDGICSVVNLAHCKLPHFGVINWDIVVDADCNIKIIEYNLIDSSIDWHQVNIGPIFGDQTDNILSKVLQSEHSYYCA